MAELYFQNLDVEKPAMVQSTVYGHLQAYYQYLERAKAYLERTRPELRWKVLGTPVALEPPKGTRDVDTWTDALFELLDDQRFTISTGRNGEGLAVLAVHTDVGVVVLDSVAEQGIEVELRAGKEKPVLQAKAVPFADFSDLEKALEGDGVWIELEDPGDENGEKTLEAFFDEDTKVLFEVDPNVGAVKDRYPPQRRIRIDDADREQLALKVDRLPRTSEVCVQPNTYTIRCEIGAIRALEDRPVAAHRPLIRLFEHLDPDAWPVPERIATPFDWHVLRNPKRPGTLEQRDFVERAMMTPDFMLLEGPPGSGKTTAIVELILQYAARGKRVLLCASTHVAVDNVIEKLKDPKRTGAPVLVVRIGKEKNISDDVKDYRLEKMVDKELDNLRKALRAEKQMSRAQQHMLEAIQGEKGTETIRRILLDSADVVCGTTIGILKHPDIEALTRGHQPWEPAFDALILDEASKTPFAEFLVPALLAKRWIVVGDRRQLAPHVEESWIETNVDASLPDGALSRTDLGNALLDTFEVATARGASALVVASDKAEVREFYAAHVKAMFPDEPVVKLDAQSSPNEFSLGIAKAVIGTVDQLENVEVALPLSTSVLRIPDGALPKVQRCHDARMHRPADESQSRDRKSHKSCGRNEDEPTWSKSVSWRICRDYELRMLPELLPAEEGTESADKYMREIQLLLPRDEALARVGDDIGQVRRVALPSILESLQVGFDHARATAGRMAWNNVLAFGLPGENVLEHRLVRLRYQHRMHPDISEFPRMRIYARDKLLQDPPGMANERPFAYPRFAGRSIFLDVRGLETPSPIRNEAEARVILDEIGKLAKWASSTQRDEPWSVAILTFYRGQERCIRDKLRTLTKSWLSRYFIVKERDRVLLKIELCTVDRYQGHEADIVFLSFTRTNRPGFLNSPNRLNVGLTRARYQLVLVGHWPFLARQHRNAPVCAWLAEEMKRQNRVEFCYGEG